MKEKIFIEFRKIIRSRYYLVSLLFFCLLAAENAIHAILTDLQLRQDIEKFYFSYITQTYTSNPMFGISTAYNYWIGVDHDWWSSFLFFRLFPLVVAFGAGLSLYKEKKSGYRRIALPKTGRKEYYLSKYIASFFMGGTVVFIPMIINLLIIFAFIPARIPSPIFQNNFGVFSFDFMAYIFYTHPDLYVAFFLFLNFIYAGLFSCISITLSMFSKKVTTILFSPYLFMVVLSYTISLLSAFRFYIELSPFSFLRAARSPNIINGYVLLGEALVLLAFSIIGYFREVNADVM